MNGPSRTRTTLRATLAALAGLALAAMTITLAAAAPGGSGPEAAPASVPADLPEVAPASSPQAYASILYVYKRDTAKAGEFQALLNTEGFGVTVVPISAVAGIADALFSSYDMFMIADDTGYLNEWGLSPADAAVIARITGAHKPVIGLGEGGYSFFGKAGSLTGWPNGWHGPQSDIYVSALNSAYFSATYDLRSLAPGPFPLYTAPVNEVGIYRTVAPTVTMIAWEPRFVNQKPDPDHAPLTVDGCYHLWGFSGGPSSMNDTGKKLFTNATMYMRGFIGQCPSPAPPPPNCLTITKSDSPPSGATVSPGDSVQYTLSYTVTDNAQCATQRTLLIDQVPANTAFVPGSASGGITPAMDGTLVWDLGPLGAAAHGFATFAATVLDSVCNGPQFITNTAQLKSDIGVFGSNQTSHKVSCPVITLPNQDPPYAEREVQVYPYPLVAGRSTRLSVQLDNSGATSQTVTVTFETSPDRFGIGLAFTALPVAGNPRVVTIGPHGSTEIQVNWTPAVSGLTCIRVKIEGAGFAPLYTWRNLDVTENLQPGATDVLAFKVGNPTATTADVLLVVNNTCPGWTAWVSPTVLTAMPGNDGEIRNAELTVVVPTPAVLGTGCHIDVEGWVNGHLIGGIRKVDVPPVHPTPGNPPWLEQEITTVPTIPVSGTVNQVCVELQNPLAITKTITVVFSEAVFGAGIGFTPFATRSFDLPPNSIGKYCTNWTPLATTVLHRCLLVTVQQPGFLDKTSQRNLDIAHLPPGLAPVDFSVPIRAGNPLPYTSTLTLDARVLGLSGWTPGFTPAPPVTLGPGASRAFTLTLTPAMMAQGVAAAAVGPATFGDVVRVDVTILLDGEPAGGFSIDLAPPLQVFLPLVQRAN